jgi:hypothetical protein
VIDDDVLMYTLDEMISSKYTFLNHKGQRGYLIYKSNQYIFQPSSSYDEKMSIDEREVYNAKLYNLPIESLLAQTKFNKPAKIIETHKKDSPQQQVSESVLEKVKKIVESSQESVLSLLIAPFRNDDDVEYIVSDKSELFDYAVKHGVAKKGTQKTSQAMSLLNALWTSIKDKIIDAAIDRLDKNTYEAFVTFLATKYNNGDQQSDFEKKCLTSLVSSNVFILEPNNKIKYYHNHFEHELYILKDSKFKKCTPLDLAKIPQSIMKDIEGKLSPPKASSKAYVTILKGTEEPQFKIKDNPKSSGYVCQKTSSLTLDDLKKRINAMYPQIDLFKDTSIKYIKSSLCFLYELMLRAFDEHSFQRPFYIKIESKGKVKK